MSSFPRIHPLITVSKEISKDRLLKTFIQRSGLCNEKKNDNLALLPCSRMNYRRSGYDKYQVYLITRAYSYGSSRVLSARLEKGK